MWDFWLLVVNLTANALVVDVQAPFPRLLADGEGFANPRWSAELIVPLSFATTRDSLSEERTSGLLPKNGLFQIITGAQLATTTRLETFSDRPRRKNPSGRAVLLTMWGARQNQVAQKRTGHPLDSSYRISVELECLYEDTPTGKYRTLAGHP